MCAILRKGGRLAVWCPVTRSLGVAALCPGAVESLPVARRPASLLAQPESTCCLLTSDPHSSASPAQEVFPPRSRCLEFGANFAYCRVLTSQSALGEDRACVLRDFSRPLRNRNHYLYFVHEKLNPGVQKLAPGHASSEGQSQTHTLHRRPHSHSTLTLHLCTRAPVRHGVF